MPSARFFLLPLLLLLLRSPLPAQTGPAAGESPADRALREAAAAEARFDLSAALDAYLRADAARPDDPQILQKIARQYSDLANETADADAKRQRLGSALAYTRRALALAPRDAVNVLSLAVIYGKLALLADTHAKVEDSRLVKRYAEEALALDPDYAFAHHVLGRWHYEVATLGATKRWLVRVLYGGLPPASTAEAVRHLRRAVELAPDVPAHHVELGFALLADGQRTAARESFRHALALSPHEKYDLEAQDRARTALAGL